MIGKRSGFLFFILVYNIDARHILEKHRACRMYAKEI